MKAVFPEADHTVQVRDIESPKIVSAGDVIVEMRACGLCGSDLEKIYGEYAMRSGRLGHEPAGEVIEVGSSAGGVAKGDRVFMHHHVACYSCHYCRHGDYTMCPKYQESNISPCGLAELVLVPEWNVSRGGLLKLPDSVSYEEASLIEPLACCLRAWGKCSFAAGDNVLVMGAGPTGLMHVLIAKMFGAGKIFVSDLNAFRLQVAQEIGAVPLQSQEQGIVDRIKRETEGRGADLCIVATGSPRAALQSLDVTRRGGDIVIFGVPPKGTQLPLDLSALYSRELSLVPTYAASETETNMALKIIENRRLDLRRLVTHRFDISQAQEAVKCAHEAKDAVKVVVTNKI